ncbi:other/AgaK1 protein kinase [Pholiota molesta]|nr:other/AgaK1 protein kinase [Pholiota molesta]
MKEVLKQKDVEDWDAVWKFWDSPDIIEWFRKHGYTLYHRTWSRLNSTTPTLPFDEAGECSYPYAYHNGTIFDLDEMPLRTSETSGRVIYAQDSQLRHVAIKLILADGEEYRILRFLHDKGPETLQANCILPVLDFLPFNDFLFVVMPRWGGRVAVPSNHTMREILDVMHSMLKGLTFLHAHNIIHRDIKLNNLLINHFSDDGSALINENQVKLRREGKLIYALIDFDVSLMAPPDIKREDYRLPYGESFIGSGNQPYDTSQGEFDYNPFAYDVGSTGVEFCNHFQQYSRHIHMLAPLLDKMTTQDVKSRFTAAEALQFFEDMYLELTEDQLTLEEYPNPKGIMIRHDEYDRWEDLPEDFQRKWAAYRNPRTPFITRALRTIYFKQWLPTPFIPTTRWFFFKLTSFPRSVFLRFTAFLALR